ncbi:cytochrome c biogenesis protein DipZ [Labrys wisconsinensis]|uniref:Cytochrome c biogenesis protein CcdA/thiol-disulfide isomerase/thioredoxin n=1 Tax=Labrys wisconsinensis TaxID=425677 RepID=A0ABU0J3R0_9HYPH|nr:cytochrome c biogenesis protein DipZ [Labrys wisconsinensis]MDQ0468910.1 cytochrome c biogenesis protein CcdA/thiol-disulfide isomerase/thioredoxin [Labrys wisconsinensis]
MLLALVSYLGGVLTIVSPCILPILPFVFARADKPFRTSTLPMLVGMTLTFALVASLAAVGGGWAVRANEYGRIAALVLLAAFGVALLLPSLADRLARPLVAAGARLSEAADRQSATGSAVLPSFLLGVATGLLWAPCAGPILGLLLTGAALNGASATTSLLLLAYATGAATSLALALLVGGRAFAAMKRSLGVGEWVRRGLGLAVLCGVVAIAFGLDTGLLTRLSLASTASLEQGLVDKVRPMPAQAASPVMIGSSDMMSGPDAAAPAPAADEAQALPSEGVMPSLNGAVQWLNSPPLTAEGLRGKVVLIDFWTYSCINCLRAIPYVEAWARKYRDQGLVVIGVHAPEFAFERNVANVEKAIRDLGIDYPVAIDNDYAIWRAFNNEYWPAHYFIDAKGRIRHHHFGEGEYDGSEKVIQALLAEAGHAPAAASLVTVDARGVHAAADMANVQSPETYIGYERAENFASPGGADHDRAKRYSAAPSLDLNQWSLGGDWTIGAEAATLNAAEGTLTYRFHARDLHLVLGPGSDGKPVRFKVLVDGKPPQTDHGTDTDADGNGTIVGQRLYQLVRQAGAPSDRTFEIEFLDPGAQAFAFTFG